MRFRFWLLRPPNKSIANHAERDYFGIAFGFLRKSLLTVFVVPDGSTPLHGEAHSV